jgi:predicted protein tyrosine phosphatase
MRNDYAHEILPNLFLGSMWATCYHELSKRRIDCVLNVADNECDANRGQYSLKEWKIIKLNDSPDETTVQLFMSILPDAFEMIDRCYLTHSRLLVHCVAGNSRSAAVVIAWLMKRHNLTYEQALSYVREKRDTVNPNVGFARALSTLYLFQQD